MNPSELQLSPASRAQVLRRLMRLPEAMLDVVEDSIGDDRLLHFGICKVRRGREPRSTRPVQKYHRLRWACRVGGAHFNPWLRCRILSFQSR